MDVPFPAMLLLDVSVRDVDMLDRCVVVLVTVSGEQMSPVLTTVQVVRHVEVLVTVLDGLVLMTPRLRHQLPSPVALGLFCLRPYTVQRRSEMDQSDAATPPLAASGPVGQATTSVFRLPGEAGSTR